LTSIDTYHLSPSFLLARANLLAHQQDEIVFKMNENENCENFTRDTIFSVNYSVIKLGTGGPARRSGSKYLGNPPYLTKGQRQGHNL